MDERRVARLARRQDGLVTVDQLLRLGSNVDQIEHWIELHRWERIHRRVIGIAGSPETATRSLRAALLASPQAAASHHSAGILHGFTQLRRGPLTITAPLGAHHELAGVLVHRTGTLAPHHIVTKSGMRVTSPSRTVIDLAADLPDRGFRRLIEDQLAAGRVGLDQCVDIIAELPIRGRRGVARARRIVLGLDVTPPPESELEARMLELIGRAGIALPARQLQLPWTDREVGRVDFAWPDRRVIVETDGRRYHARIDAFERDRRRDQLALAAGWRTLRFTWRQVVNEPRHVRSILERVLC